MGPKDFRFLLLICPLASAVSFLFTLSPAWPAPPTPGQPSNDENAIPKGAALRLGATEMRVGRPINDIVFLHNAPYAVTLSDRSLLLWNTDTGKLVTSSTTPPLAISPNLALPISLSLTKLAASGDGKYFVLNWHGQLFRYSLPFKGDPDKWASSIPHQSLAQFVVDSAGEYLYGLNQSGEFVEWKRGDDKWKVLRSGTAKASKSIVVVGNDIIAYSNDGSNVNTYDASKKAAGPTIGLQAPLSSLSISGDGKFLAIGCVATNPKIKISMQLWDIVNHKVITNSPVLANLSSLNKDGTILATSRLLTGGNVDIYDAKTMTKITTLTNPPDPLKLFQLNDRGTILITAGQQGTIRASEISSGLRFFAGDGHIAPISAALATRAGSFISSGLDGSIILWDKHGKAIRRFIKPATQPIRGLSLSNDESTLYSGGSDRTVCAWDVATGRELRSHTLEFGNAVYSLAISPDSRHIAVGAVDQVILLDAATLKPIHPPMAGGDGPIAPVSFSSNDRFFTRNLKSEIKCWSVESGGLLYTIDTKSQQLGRSPLATTPDGKKMLSSLSPSDFLAGGALYLATWSPATGKLLDKIELDFPLSVIAVDPSGKKVAVGSQSGDIVIFNSDDKLPKTTLKGHRGRVSALSFSPDGQFLISGSDDTTSIVWSMTNR